MIGWKPLLQRMDAEAPLSLDLLCWSSLRWPSAGRTHPRQSYKPLAQIEPDTIQGSVSHEDLADDVMVGMGAKGSGELVAWPNTR